MKNPVKADTLKYLIPGAGGLGLVLRILLYATGIDGRGLLVRGYWASTLLCVLTLAVLFFVFLATRSLGGSVDHRAAYPVSAAAAIGAFAAMIGIGITTLGEFAEFSSRLHLLIWALGLLSAVFMGCIGICRLTGKKPSFLLSAVICLYFALRMVSRYQSWSADPQLQDYCFYLMAYVALMLTAYQHAAFDEGLGNHRALWFCSLMAVYLCCVSLKGTTDLWLLLGCGIWAFTNLTSVTVCPRRRHAVPDASEESDGRNQE